MIAHYIKKKDLITLFESDSILRLYDSFLKNESIKYVAVVDKAGRPKGLIYRNNLPSMSNTASVADFLAKQMVTVGTDTKIEEVDRILFQLAKKNINEIVAVNKEGVLEGIYEKIIRECSDFYEKYAFIKREGYSLSDWFHHYYGENAVIGIHSYSEYTVLLLDELRDSGMEVKFICQSGGNSRGAWGKFLEKPFSEISEEELKECDIVVNAFLSLKEQVHYLYKQYKKYDKVINLYDIVDELYHYERDAGYMIRIANIIARGGRKVYLFDYPVLSEQTIRSERENILLREHWNTPKVREKIQAHDPGKYSELENLLMPSLNKARKKYGKKEVSFSDIKSYFPSFSEKSNAHIKYVGESCMIYDMKSLYVNIKNGMRISLLPNGEEKAGSQTKIHFFGKSWVYGYHSSDEFTIPSFVQRISNEKKLGFHVYNHGIPGLREDRIANMMYEWDNRVPKDDIFVLIHMFGDYGNSYNKKVALEYDYIEPLSSDRPHDYGEIWMDSGHIGEDGNELLAKQVIDYIENGKTAPGIFKNKFNTTAGRKVYRYEKMDRASLWAEIPEFRKYQEYLSSHR